MTTDQRLMFARMGLVSLAGCLAAAGPEFTPYLSERLLLQLARVAELEQQLAMEET
jgi:hypothetical protein